MSKRFFALLLSVVMVLGVALVPVQAFAEETADETVVEEPVEEPTDDPVEEPAGEPVEEPAAEASSEEFPAEGTATEVSITTAAEFNAALATAREPDNSEIEYNLTIPAETTITVALTAYPTLPANVTLNIAGALTLSSAGGRAGLQIQGGTVNVTGTMTCEDKVYLIIGNTGSKTGALTVAAGAALSVSANVDVYGAFSVGSGAALNYIGINAEFITVTRHGSAAVTGILNARIVRQSNVDTLEDFNAAFAAALTNTDGYSAWIIDAGNITGIEFTTNTTIPANVTLNFNGCTMTAAEGTTFTNNGYLSLLKLDTGDDNVVNSAFTADTLENNNYIYLSGAALTVTTYTHGEGNENKIIADNCDGAINAITGVPTEYIDCIGEGETVNAEVTTFAELIAQNTLALNNPNNTYIVTVPSGSTVTVSEENTDLMSNLQLVINGGLTVCAPEGGDYAHLSVRGAMTVKDGGSFTVGTGANADIYAPVNVEAGGTVTNNESILMQNNMFTVATGATYTQGLNARFKCIGRDWTAGISKNNLTIQIDCVGLSQLTSAVAVAAADTDGAKYEIWARERLYPESPTVAQVMTLENNLTIPANTLFSIQSAEIIVPDGVTLTLDGNTHLEAEILENTVTGEYEPDLTNRGTITVQSGGTLINNGEMIAMEGVITVVSGGSYVHGSTAKLYKCDYSDISGINDEYISHSYEGGNANVGLVTYDDTDYTLFISDRGPDGVMGFVFSTQIVTLTPEQLADGDTVSMDYLLMAASGSGDDLTEATSFYQYITGVAYTLEDNEAGAVTLGATSNEAVTNAYGISVSVGKIGTAKLVAEITYKLPEDEESKTCWAYIAIECIEDGNREVTRPADDTVEALNAYLQSVDLAELGVANDCSLLVNLPPIEYTGTIVIPDKSIILQGTYDEDNTVRTSVKGGVILRKLANSGTNSKVVDGISGIDFTATAAVTTGILCESADVFRITDCTLKGYAVAVDCTPAGFASLQYSGTLFENNGIALRVNCAGKTNGNSTPKVCFNRFLNNRVAVQVIALPESIAPYYYRIFENEFINNTTDIDCASQPGTLYCYRNYFGTERNGHYAPKTPVASANAVTSPLYLDRIFSDADGNFLDEGDMPKLSVPLSTSTFALPNDAANELLIDTDTLMRSGSRVTIDVVDAQAKTLGSWKFATNLPQTGAPGGFSAEGAPQEGTFNAGLTVTAEENSITVTVKDNAAFDGGEVELVIPCPESWVNAEVTKNSSAVDSYYDFGTDKIRFPVSAGGTYTITRLLSVPVYDLYAPIDDITVTVGAKATIGIEIYPEYATTKELSWVSTDETVAQVSEAGVVTGIAAGTATITATSTDGTNITSNAVTVHVGALVKTITIAGDANVTVGGTSAYTATCGPADAGNQNVVWSVRKGTGSATVTAEGVLTGKSVGTVTLVATAADGGGVTATKSIRVNAAKADDRVVIIGSVSGAKVGDIVTVPVSMFGCKEASVIQMTIRYNNVLLQLVSADPAAGIGIADINTQLPGMVILATDATDSFGVSGVLLNLEFEVAGNYDNDAFVEFDRNEDLIVYNADTNLNPTFIDGGVDVVVNTPVAGMILSESETSVFVGGQHTLCAQLFPVDATLKTLTWSTTDAKIATVTNGTVKGIGRGTATITATANDGSGVSASCAVTVVQPVTAVKLNKTLATLYTGVTEQLTATVMPENADNADVVWSSSDEAVATVDDGVITPVSAGTANIICTAADGSGKLATCRVTVNQAVTGIEIEGSGNIAQGKTVTLKAVISPDNAKLKTVDWTTSNAGVATVSATGLVKGVNAGTATITATAKDGSGITDTFEVTVKAAATGVQIFDASDKNITGTTIPLEMTDDSGILLSALVLPYIEDGTGLDTASQTVTWKSSNPKTATVDNGLVKPGEGARAGVVTITATATDGTNKSATVKVNVAAISDQILFTSAPAAVAAGKSVQLTAVASNTDSTATNTATNKTVTWSTVIDWTAAEGSEGTAPKITATGRFTAGTAQGTATVTVTAKDNPDNTITHEIAVKAPATGVTILNKSNIPYAYRQAVPVSLSDGTVTLKSAVLPADAGQDVTWKTSSAAVASIEVNADGSCTVTLNKAGTVMITCTAADGSLKSTYISLKITA